MQSFPEHWEAVSLKDVVSYRKGKKPKVLSNIKTEGTVPYVDIKAFSTGDIRRYADIKSSNLTSKENVLVVWDGARSGLVGIGQGGAIGSTIMALRPIEIDSMYLFRFLQTQYETINSNPRGTGIPHVDPGLFWNIKTPIAPLNEQHRIVAKLEKLLQKVDACKERLHKIPTILKRFRQSILAAACSGRLTEDWRKENPDVEPASIFLKRIVNDYKGKVASTSFTYPMGNDIPESWILCNLGTLAELITKGSSPNWQGINYVDKGILFITSENVGSGHLILENKKFVEGKFNQIQKRSILKRGDILTNIVGASIGRTAIFDLDEKANINQAVSLIRLKNKMSSNYILMVLNSPAIVDFMNSTKVDVARANLSLKDVASFPIPLPPLTEQHEIVHRVEALFKIADQIEKRYKKARTYIDKLTQSILAKAFRGELVLQDPNDEPASELLKRIKTECAVK